MCTSSFPPLQSPLPSSPHPPSSPPLPLTPTPSPPPLTPTPSPQLTTLELQYVSPKLLACQDLELAVPGTYEPNQPIIHIKRVAASLNVITSKQRPRKLVIQGRNPSDQSNLFVIVERCWRTCQTAFCFKTLVRFC